MQKPCAKWGVAPPGCSRSAPGISGSAPGISGALPESPERSRNLRSAPGISGSSGVLPERSRSDPGALRVLGALPERPEFSERDACNAPSMLRACSERSRSAPSMLGACSEHARSMLRACSVQLSLTPRLLRMSRHLALGMSNHDIPSVKP